MCENVARKGKRERKVSGGEGEGGRRNGETSRLLCVGEMAVFEGEIGISRFLLFESRKREEGEEVDGRVACLVACA